MIRRRKYSKLYANYLEKESPVTDCVAIGNSLELGGAMLSMVGMPMGLGSVDDSPPKSPSTSTSNPILPGTELVVGGGPERPSRSEVAVPPTGEAAYGIHRHTGEYADKVSDNRVKPI